MDREKNLYENNFSTRKLAKQFHEQPQIFETNRDQSRSGNVMNYSKEKSLLSSYDIHPVSG